MVISGKTLKAIVLGVVFSALAVSAYAAPVRTFLEGQYDDVKKLQVDAVVTLDAGTYTYTYTVTYIQGLAAVHIFSVDNPNNTYYDTAATNSGFELPSYAPYEMIRWGKDDGPYMLQGESRWFSYKSRYAPQDITVYAYAMDGGAYAEGETVGMGDVIPEPGSFAVLALGLIGVMPRLLKRR